jgi:hypothetical protein
LVGCGLVDRKGTSADDVRVHPLAADVLSLFVDDEDVDLIEGERGHDIVSGLQ